MEEVPLPKKVKSPFPNLVTFHGAAVILSYLAYSDEIQKLLQRLSKNTAQYYLKHKMSLDGFLVVWHPFTANEVVEFGNQNKKWTLAFPEKEFLTRRSRLTVMPKYKLNSITIGKFDQRVLGGLQLELYDEQGGGWIVEKMLASEGLRQDVKPISHAVAAHSAVSSISMFCMGDEFYGLRLKDQDGKAIFEQKWFNPSF